MKKEEQEQLITDFAYAAERYLIDVGCIREADNVEPIWASTDDICEAVGAAKSLWYSIKQRMLELGIPLALAYFGGYYIGKEGEQSTILIHKGAMIRGLANGAHEDILSLARSGTLDDVKKLALQRFGADLSDIPKMLRSLGSPLPPQIEILLIEAERLKEPVAA